jgi:uncharacterized Zn-binding protein involved in type VI secretion
MDSALQARFAGIEISPLTSGENERKRDFAWIEQATLGGRVDADQMPKPRMRTTPIYRDAAGDEWMVLPGEEGLTTLPYVSGSPLDLWQEKPRDGGFVDAESLRRRMDPAAMGKLSQELRALQMALMAALAKAAAAAPPSSSGSQARPGQTKPSNASGPGSGNAPADEGEPQSSPGRPSAWEQFRDGAASSAAQGAGQAVFSSLVSAYAQSGSLDAMLGAIKGGDLVKGLAGGALSGVVGLGVQTAFNSLWAVDDNSSATEQVAHKFAQDLVGMLPGALTGSGSSLVGKIVGNFGGGGPSPLLAAIREGDLDIKGNKVSTGSSDVIIETHPAARVTDPVDKTGVVLSGGSTTVLVNALSATRLFDTVSKDGKFPKGAVRTFIGGASSTGAALPPPGAAGGGSGGSGGDGGGESGGDSGSLPECPAGRDPPEYSCLDPVKGEWNPLDDVNAGFANTPEEYDSIWPTLPDWLRNIFRADENGYSLLGIQEIKDHWYLLGGLIDLGSPHYPGAGTGNFWWIPDRVFWMDMRNYFVPHDWWFAPKTFLQFFEPIYKWEIPAFLAGWSWDPIHLALQLLYSAATTSISYLVMTVNSLKAFYRWAQARSPADEANDSKK